jgi:hypothetical protein
MTANIALLPTGPRSRSAIDSSARHSSTRDESSASSRSASGSKAGSPVDSGRLHEARTLAAAREELGAAELARALREGTWVQPWWGVVVPEHRRRDPLTRAAGALLRGGRWAVLSGATAAAMHGCTAADGDTLHVTVPYDRQLRSCPGLSARQAWVRESDVVELDGLRTQALDVALAELLCTGLQRVALASLEQALGWFPPAAAEGLRRLVGERLDRRRDRRGTRRATGLLELAWVGGAPAPAARKSPSARGGAA